MIIPRIIAPHAFYSCNQLTSVIIPSSVINLGCGSSVFYGCSKLKTITFEKGSQIEKIDENAFYECSDLISIEIPDSVTSIGSYAFSSCSSLTSIVIPNSVTSIGSNAFRECSSLTIYCEASSKPSGWSYSWNSSSRPVYWAGKWEYDANGNPVPLY